MILIAQTPSDRNILLECSFSEVILLEDPQYPESPKEVLKRYDGLLKREKIVAVLYKDENGIAAAGEIIRRYGANARVLDGRDLEESLTVLYSDGGSVAVRELIHQVAKRIPGIRDLEQEPYEGLERFCQGPFIATGFPKIDKALNSLAPGLVTLVTGRSNSGKSTFTLQVIANAIDQSAKVFWASGEGLPELLLNQLYRLLIGEESEHYYLRKVNLRSYIEPTEKSLRALQKWHKGKLVFFSKSDSPLKTTDELFALLSEQIKDRSCQLIVLDNLMSLLSVERASEKLERQADFMQRCCDLAKCYGVHVVLVVHPRKNPGIGQESQFEDISGSSDLANKSDNIIAVSREHDPLEIALQKHGQIRILKNRYHRELDGIDTYFNERTHCLNEWEISPGRDPCPVPYRFSWKQHLQEEVSTNQ